MTLDRAKVWEFLEHFGGLTSGAALIGVLAVADRSGLLAALANEDWVTPAELAQGRFVERYVEEILSALAAGGIVEYDPDGGRFYLPPEHAACLVDPTSPYLMAGWFDMLPALMRSVDAVAAVAVHGGGIPIASFDDRLVAGIDRANSPAMKILLTRKWLPVLPDLVARLEAGAQVADIGCGSGAAALTMARAYPASTVVGYDLDPRAIERARIDARSSDLDNVTFEQLPAEQIPDGFDLITAFDVIHDLPDPVRVLTRVREALHPDGMLFMMEPNAAPTLEGNMTPYGALLYGMSVLYCLPQSLTSEGPGLGTAWGPERAERLCREVGFSHFRRLEIENAFSAFYEVKP
ncbi:MAG TPA: class I SAM-dependent methyltransferase [Acidimicrobiia bacterium]|nr:class I SAM-dependent methyltransferase [Acidimicrobiia bacterium]